MKRVLIKIGGRALEGEQGFKELATAIQNMPDSQFIIVHGGGVEISNALKAADRPFEFIDGIRATRAEDMEIVEDVLSNTVNKRIADFLEKYGVTTKRMSGKTDNMIIVEPYRKNNKDYGFVGQIKQVNAEHLTKIIKDKVAVISPVSTNEIGQSYNVNADTAAAAVAVAAQCTDLVYFTDVPGVKSGDKTLSQLTISEGKELIQQGIIKDGMVAKMESIFKAIKDGVKRVYIAQWQNENTLTNLLEKPPENGTMIKE